MLEPSKWDWADSVSGFFLGIVGGVVSLFGWFSRKVGTVHGRIDGMVTTATTHSTDIAVLKAHHEAHLQSQKRIEGNLSALNVKQDEQLKILLELKGRGH